METLIGISPSYSFFLFTSGANQGKTKSWRFDRTMPRSRRQKSPVLDLHGRTTDEVFNLMDQYITKYSHAPKVKVIVGKGTGAVKKKTLEYLKIGNYPWKYETVYGKINEGCLIVELG